jgi:predicted nucleotidyltransferase
MNKEITNKIELDLIVDKLKESINPFKIILFGSYAYGNPSKDSDIDLLVVTNDNSYPKNYKEKMEKYLNISTILSRFKKEIPIDLIVHTIPMHKRFIELGSMFSKEILKNGKVLYERYN